MDIRSLRFAISLAEELHFGRAAERHYISPQPFGRYIQELERELGVKLFERTSRRVTLTPAGARVLAEARSILTSVDALTEPRRWTEPDEDRVTIGALGSVLDQLQELTAMVSRWIPGLSFAYRELHFDDQFDAIRSHQVDVGIVLHADSVEGITLEPVLAVRKGVAVPAGSPYADADLLTPADVQNAAWVPIAGPPEAIAWAGPVAEFLNLNIDGIRSPSAIAAAVATTGRLSLHAPTTPWTLSPPRPEVHFVPLDVAPSQRAIATRNNDNRPAIAAFRCAARLFATPTPPHPHHLPPAD